MKEERRKKRRRTERILSDSHSLSDKTGLAIQSVSLCTPTRDNLPCCLTHTPSCRAHTQYLSPFLPPYHPSPPSPPPSVLDNPSPTSQIPSLSKKIFPRAWITGSHMLRAGTKGKCTAHMQMRQDTNTHTHTKTYKTQRLSQYTDDSICLSQIITLHPLFFSPSLSVPAWVDTCVCQYGEFTHHWQSWHCCCCCLFPLSMLANVNHKKWWAGKTRTRNDSCEPHWAGLRVYVRAHMELIKK